MAFVNNYSTSFRYLDFIFGTDDKYREHRARVAKAKAAMKGASKEEQEAMEQKLNGEAERAGQVAEAAAEKKGAWLLGGKA